MRTFLAGLALLLPATLLPVPATAAPVLRFVFTDRTGAPATRATATLVNLGTGALDRLTSDGGVATVPAEPGRYAVFATVHTDPGQVSLLARPRLDVTGAATVALDARRARPIDVRVPERTATVAAAVVSATLTYSAGGETRVVDEAVTTADASRLSAAHLGPDENGFHSSVKVNMAEPDVRTSPYLYSLYWRQDGRMFTGLRRHLTDRRGLTTVQADYALLASGTDAHTTTFAGDDPALGTPIALPRSRTEHYTADVAWHTMLCHGPGGAAEPLSCLSGAPGGRWNQGPFLPAARLVERLGDRLRVIADLEDQSGHAGLARSDIRDGRLRLYRDGELVGEQPLDRPGWSGLPDAPADYRIELDGESATLLPGSRFHAAWTFTSGYAPIGEGRLPALNVRFTPVLDATGHAPAGRPLTLPVRADGATELTVQASFDAGVTWHSLPLRRTEGGWTTTVTPPATAADVSLRATAGDRDGNTVEQEMTRAIPLSGETADQP